MPRYLAIGASRRQLVAGAIAPVGLFALVVLSSVETLKAEVGPVSIRPVHVVAALMALWVWRFSTAREPVLGRAVLVGCAGIAVLGLTPLFAHGDAVRLALPGLLVINLLMTYISVLVYSAAGPVLARRVVDAALAVVVAVPLLQAAASAIGAGPRYRDARVLGLGRAPGTFEEATWAGAASAFAASWFLSSQGSKAKILAIAAVAGTALASSRSAILSLAVVVVVTVLTTARIPLIGVTVSTIRRHNQRADSVAAALVAVVFAAALLFTPWSLSAPAPALDFTSVDSRILDQHAIISQQTGIEVVIGSESMRVYDVHRSRLIPSSSNNVVVDLLWKQGVFGILLLAWLSVLIAWSLPRAAGIRLPVWRYPAPLLLMLMTLAFSVVNNAVLRPWFWVFLGVAIASAIDRVGADEAS